MGAGARPEPGAREGTGPRLGRGPVVGTRRPCDWVGSGRRLEGLICGGGISDDACVLEAEGGAMDVEMDGPDALWAEFSAGNEGGGMLSSSSLPSSVSSGGSPSVKVGTATTFWALLGVTFGVDFVEDAGLVEVSSEGGTKSGSREIGSWSLLLPSDAASLGCWLGKRCV